MKKYILFFVAAATFGMLAPACSNDDEILTPSVEGLYISSLTGAPATSAGIDVTLTVALPAAAERDVVVNLTIDPTAITDGYYQAVPLDQTDLESSATVTIAKGATSATKTIHVNNFDVNDRKYALAVAISSTDAGITVDSEKSKASRVLGLPLSKVSAPNFRVGKSGNVLFAMPGQYEGTDSVKSVWDIQTTDYTVEFWAKMDYYNSQNFQILNMYDAAWTKYECFFRFGDANREQGNPNGQRCYVNWKIGADGSVNLTGAYDLIAGAWNHWAMVYTGADGVATLYKNGEEYLTDAAAEPETEWEIGMFSLVGSHQRTNDSLYLSEVRLWTKALTVEEISANKNRSVDPQSEDLEGYWPLDKASYSEADKTFKDLTSNGHTLYGRWSVLSSFNWASAQTLQQQ
ncbi:MAG: DUF1735 and LamG domain-containing protein [Prevotellaceae bacterium]|jgi:hypothetical protein|nr:DUF1735 and LamG domain-containing protein [Prevotellaceae bacterium]